LETEKGFSFGVTTKSLDFITDEVVCKNQTDENFDTVGKKVNFIGLTLFAFPTEQLNMENLKETDAKKVLINLLKKMTYHDMFSSDLIKKFTPGAVNVPVTGEIDIQFCLNRKDVMFSDLNVQFKLDQFSFSLVKEYYFEMLKYVELLIKPFEIYQKVAKLKYQYIEFSQEMQEKASAINSMFQAYHSLREKMKQQYLNKKNKKRSETIKLEEFSECFPSKTAMTAFKNLLLSLDFEILFAAIRNAFLLTSKVNQIDEKNIATVFLTQAIGPSPDTKKTFFDLLIRFYSDVLIEKEKFNMEETQTE
jgi:hypothetical protein